jgi:hypothetical protein
LNMLVNPREVKPPTGEPDAGDPHVRFGGRGGANQCAIPTPIVKFFRKKVLQSIMSIL